MPFWTKLTLTHSHIDRQDLGRPEYESLICDVSSTLSEAREAIANVKAWMRPESVPTNLLNHPASSRLERVPKGVGQLSRVQLSRMTVCGCGEV